MGDATEPHPIIVDTDALIAVANTSLWSRIIERMQMTTTSVCIVELKHHNRESSEHALEGSREKRIHEGSSKVLSVFEDDSNSSFVSVVSVPRPHGKDAGERSIEQEIKQNPGRYRLAVSMDRQGRDVIDRAFDKQTEQGQTVAPSYLLYLLYKHGHCSKEDFCNACSEMMTGEGWTNYSAVQAIWEEIPVDCSEYIDTSLLA